MQEYTNSQEALAAVDESKTFVIANLNDFDEVAHKTFIIAMSCFTPKLRRQAVGSTTATIWWSGAACFSSTILKATSLLRKRPICTSVRCCTFIRPFCAGFPTPQTDLTQCFQRDGGEQFSHKVLLSKSQQSQVNQLLQRLSSTSTGYGQDIMEQSVFCELMVLLNQLFTQSMEESQQPAASNDTNLVDDIIKYITKTSLTGCRFPSSPHTSTSATPMSAGPSKPRPAPPPTSISPPGGSPLPSSTLLKAARCSTPVKRAAFGDYTNFVKAFTKLVGISPKKYEKLHAQERAPKKRA